MSSSSAHASSSARTKGCRRSARRGRVAFHASLITRASHAYIRPARREAHRAPLSLYSPMAFYDDDGAANNGFPRRSLHAWEGHLLHQAVPLPAGHEPPGGGWRLSAGGVPIPPPPRGHALDVAIEEARMTLTDEERVMACNSHVRWEPQEEGMMRTAASFPSERNQGLSNQEEPRSTLKVDGGGCSAAQHQGFRANVEPAQHNQSTLPQRNVRLSISPLAVTKD
ncbi:hypothetical protein QYE76_070756 [Lolium multiflorum]|uniref:Uncharacterized protein n=1 Tax=Lolium multiflorum TaxID=4521 RepID=A0AAD8WDX6_LOLMU|nr:hypothetical protein QYE76_070756 [Lolium multiflorum]